MRKKFRSGELEQDFDVLFGKNANWSWPFFEDDIFTSAINLCVGGFIAWLFFSLFGLNKFFEEEIPFWVYVIIAFTYALVINNYHFVWNWNKQRKLRKKYLPLIENTDAYTLLLDALDSCKNGVVEGLSTREESNEYLSKLWKAAFAEQSSLRGPLKILEAGGNLIDDRPIGEQVKAYFNEREVAFNELQA